MTHLQKVNAPDFFTKMEAAFKQQFDTDQRRAVILLAHESQMNNVTDLNQFAYILATCYHECRFKSIPEIRAKRGTKVWQMQEKYWYTGYYGRGFSQLTWRANYEKFEKRTALPLVANPDLVLKPEVGAEILVDGMVNGLFSGVKLSRYIQPGKPPDFLRARRVVNGNFQADKVRNAALIFVRLLSE